MPKSDRIRGFTLIELLIVVAIIAILAAIAVPNFLEAQIRSKVSRAKTDMRTIRVAMEAYRVENEAYPPDVYGAGDMGGPWRTWYVLTTPIAYLTRVPPSPFWYRDYVSGGHQYPGMPPYDYSQYDHPYTYRGEPEFRPHALVCRSLGLFWTVTCSGPDEKNDMQWQNIAGLYLRGSSVYNDATAHRMLYDPTNGTVSDGDIILTNRGFPN